MGRHHLQAAIVICVAVVLASCQRLWINPPSDEYRTALVLPTELDNRSEHGGHGFEYIYRIEKLDGGIEPLEVVFRFPIPGDMIIVDSLPPGDYRVSQFRFQQRGSGDFSYGNNIQRRNDRFRLERNHITILNRSLNLRVFNATPGRGMSTSYDIRIEPLRTDQRERVLATLQELEHFGAWQIFDETSPRAQRKLHGDWTGDWVALTEKSSDGEVCTAGELAFTVEGLELKGRGIAHDDTAVEISATFDDSGYLRGKLLIAARAAGKITGRLYPDNRILGTFSFDDGCEAQWSARYNGGDFELGKSWSLPPAPGAAAPALRDFRGS